MIRLYGQRPGIAKPALISTTLEQEIRSGALRFGDRLPSENELVKRFSVSRNTVRKALEGLTERGFITTKVGIGSFVVHSQNETELASGWSQMQARPDIEAEARIVRLEAIDDHALAVGLGLENSRFIAVDRVRTNAATGQAISIERSRVPMTAELEDISLSTIREGSLHHVLRGAGLTIHHGEEWTDLSLLGPADAAILDSAVGTPFLRSRRLTRTMDNRPIEYVTSLINPNFFTLHLEF